MASADLPSALPQPAEASAVAAIDLEYIELLHSMANGMINELYRPQPLEAKNAHGEVVNELDIVVQKYFARMLREKYPSHLIVGEEETPDVCDHKFPSSIPVDADIWTIDPVDGSKILQSGSAMCSTVIGFQRGRIPIFGSARKVADDMYIVGGRHWPVTINGKLVPGPRPYDPNNIEIAYGLGKRKSDEDKQHFMKQLGLVTSADKMLRPGHLSYSCTLLLQGEKDAYLSLKEEWYKFGPWYAIMTKAGFVTNIDPETLNINDAFSAWFATPEFAARHLQDGSELAMCMQN